MNVTTSTESKIDNTQALKIDHIQFRVVFLSPFFQLEVANGWQHWQTVRSQVPVEGTANHPVLHFTSHCAAVEYAQDTLGLQVAKLGWLKRLLRRMNPPATHHATPQAHDVEPISYVPPQHHRTASPFVVHGAAVAAN